ncbi:MAG: TIGR00730 family Rossman fold protein [Pseudomonadota bacterium]|nr:TIGR00730 family Rossman fold protein [Pseudomonadota bacterium]
MKRICVNCGSNPGFAPVYMEMAERLGAVLARRDMELVYGGAETGLMGRIADTVLRAGGQVTGIIPRSFAHRVSHRGLTELRVVDSMHERKMTMFELSDGFIALPGGFGTIEEMTELLTWSQLGLNRKPCGLINVNGFFDALLSFFDGATAEGFIREPHRRMLLEDSTPEGLLDKLFAYEAPAIDKWTETRT